ncbi:Uncharacterised protein [Bordetella pertussis]|nr:Uncharacterised protein [Bordetella pertussis]CFP66299.1 Uncharacterised protein [Bordetella pertussis]CFW12168.1 Uncharacterised protein [Bordetella pertussis]
MALEDMAEVSKRSWSITMLPAGMASTACMRSSVRA